jgi:hypothetical protein
MATSATDSWNRGYEQAVKVLTDEALATDAHERKRLQKMRIDLEASGDYQGVRHALDEAPSDFYMTRPMAQFYLSMSPGVFAKALKEGSHPFTWTRSGEYDEKQGGAQKRDVLDWWQASVQRKHEADVPKPQTLMVSRDLEGEGRPYLVDASGAILSDGRITKYRKEDALLAMANGGDLRILTLSTALGMPWRDPTERATWAAFRIAVLEDALARARQQDEEAKRQT